MKLDKRIFIHNTTTNPIDTTTVGMEVSQLIEENTRVMSLEIKKLWERIN